MTPAQDPRKASEPTAEMADKRRHRRTRKFGPQQLLITRKVAGKDDEIRGVLWDFSEGGVGMDMPRALPADEVVRMEGDLHSPYYSMHLEARARVAYCRRVTKHKYRIGFGFLEVSYRPSES